MVSRPISRPARLHLHLHEHRGYTALERVLEAVRSQWPDDHALIARVEKHRADERKHYLMFRRWFERRGVMPLALDSTFGHIDRFIGLMFGSPIDGLDPRRIIGREDLFERLCRVISLTERRGHRQVEVLLRNPVVLSDPPLTKIFRMIERDEPSHWSPYDEWLEAHGRRPPNWWERALDQTIHAELLIIRLPGLFLMPYARRYTAWPDAHDVERIP